MVGAFYHFIKQMELEQHIHSVHFDRNFRKFKNFEKKMEKVRILNIVRVLWQRVQLLEILIVSRRNIEMQQLS